MADAKITELDALTALAAADLFAVVDDVSGTATTKKITAEDARAFFGASVFNVLDYGAAGDGTTDDVAAFQAAADAAFSAGGGVVYVPARTYEFSSWNGNNANTDAYYGLRLSAGCHLVADPGATILVVGGPGAGGLGAVIGNDQTDGDEDISVIGLTVDMSAGTAGALTCGIQFGNSVSDGLAVTRGRVENCTVLGSPYLGIQLRDGCTDFQVLNNRVITAGDIGIQIGAGKRGRVAGNLVRDCADNAIDIYGDTGTTGAPNAYDVTFEGNTLEDCRCGIFLETVDRCVVAGNTITNMAESGVQVNRINSECRYNSIVGNAVETVTNGIWVIGPCYQHTITGNTVKLNTDGGVGICVEGAFRGSIIGNTVTGNGNADNGKAIRFLLGAGNNPQFWNVVGNMLVEVETPISEEDSTANIQKIGNWQYDTGGSADQAFGGTVALLDGTLVAAQGQGPMVVVAHGATAGTARPTGADAVYWVGSVEPTNAQDHDLWYDNS